MIKSKAMRIERKRKQLEDHINSHSVVVASKSQFSEDIYAERVLPTFSDRRREAELFWLAINPNPPPDSRSRAKKIEKRIKNKENPNKSTVIKIKKQK